MKTRKRPLWTFPGKIRAANGSCEYEYCGMCIGRVRVRGRGVLWQGQREGGRVRGKGGPISEYRGDGRSSELLVQRLKEVRSGSQGRAEAILGRSYLLLLLSRHAYI